MPSNETPKKWHISPIKGPTVCGAKKRCRFGQTEEQHLIGTKEEVLREYDRLMSTPAGWLELKQRMHHSETEYPRWNWDELNIKQLSDGSYLIDIDKSHWGSRSTVNDTREFWLTDTAGETVAYMKIMNYNRDTAPLVLCDIEVNENARGNGYGKKLMKLVEKRYGQTLYTTGGFTPEGFAAYGDKLPLLPEGYRSNEKSAPIYNSMTFVNDWNTLVANASH